MKTEDQAQKSAQVNKQFSDELDKLGLVTKQLYSVYWKGLLATPLSKADRYSLLLRCVTLLALTITFICCFIIHRFYFNCYCKLFVDY